MWIFCGGMHRSGSTLQYQIVSHIIEKKELGHRIGWLKAEEFDQVRKTESKQSQLLVCKTHRPSGPILDELERNGGFVFTVHRDIRDVVVSAMKKHNWTFRHIWKNGLLQKWTGQFDAWAKLPQAIVSRYDDLVINIDQEAIKIAECLNVSIRPELVSAIADEYSIQRQKDKVKRINEKKQGKQFDDKFDPESLLHYNHIVSGDTGRFRSALRPAEISAIESECGEWMQRWGYESANPALNNLEKIRRMMLGPGSSKK